MKRMGDPYSRLESELNSIREARDVLRDSLNEFKSVHELIDSFRTNMDPSRVMGNLREILARQIPFDSSGVFLWDRQNRLLSWGECTPELKQVAQEFSDEGIVDWVKGENRPVLIPDIDAIPENDEGTGWWLIDPLFAGGEELGFFICRSRASEEELTVQQLELFHHILNQTALTIHNARLYRELRETNELVNSVVQNTLETIMILDADYRITFVNSAVTEFHFQVDNFLGRRFLNLMPSESHRSELQSLVDSGKHDIIQAELLDGQQQLRSVDLAVTRLPEQGNAHKVLITIRDMTHLRELQQKALDAEKFHALSQAAVAVNHEINNPLTSILGNAFLLKSDKESVLTDKAKAKIEAIEHNGRRIQQVIKRFDNLEEIRVVKYMGEMDMLDLSGEERSEPEDT